jgi:hypothetical protein
MLDFTRQEICQSMLITELETTGCDSGQSTRLNIPEDSYIQTRRRENLKSHSYSVCVRRPSPFRDQVIRKNSVCGVMVF